MTRRPALVAGTVAAVVVLGLLARVEDRPARGPSDGAASPSATPAAESGDKADSEWWEPVGGWRPLAAAPGGPRSAHTAVWTGLCPHDAPPRSCGELLIWGGRDADGPRADGVAYDLAGDRWRRLAEAPRRPLPTAALPGVWTGEAAVQPATGHSAALIVWGATEADLAGDGDAPAEPRGAAYAPAADAWRALPDAPIAPRVGHSLTWTGEEVIVWGGRRVGDPASDEPLTGGAAYDPAADAWRRLPDAPLTGRHDHSAVWLPDAGQLVVWGGVNRHGRTPTPVIDGAAYDPAADAWAPLPMPPVTARGRPRWWQPGATRLVDPERLAVVAPLHAADTGTAVISVYDPAVRSWEGWPAGPLGGRGGAEVAGASRVVVWGGAADRTAPAGVIYHPRTDTWGTAPDGLRPAAGESATWTGHGLLLWGGGREGRLWDAGPASTAPHEP